MVVVGLTLLADGQLMLEVRAGVQINHTIPSSHIQC